jgi:hypothetical protein
MGWLIAVIVILVIIYFMIISPGFRIFAIVTIGAAGLFVWWIIEKDKRSDVERRAQEYRQEQVATSLIMPEDLHLTDLTIRKRTLDWELTGKVTNQSQHTLTKFSLAVVVREGDIIVGETTESISVTVPPGQLRTFWTAFRLPGMPEEGKFKWQHKIVTVWAGGRS